MFNRYLPALIILSSQSFALNDSTFSLEIKDMIKNSHRLKSSYYGYLQSVENQKLTHAYSYPSFYLTFSPYVYYWERDSTDEGSSGGIVGDLSKATKVSHRLLRNVSHKLHALQSGSATTQYDYTSKYDYTYSEYDAGISYTFVDFGNQKATDAMAKIDTNNSLNNFEGQKQNHILNGINIYTQIVTSRNIILYAKKIKKQIQDDLALNFTGDNINITDKEKAKSTLSNIDALIVNEQKALSKAINQYESLFGHKPINIPEYKLLSIPKSKIPKSKKVFIDSVEKNNLNLISAKNSILSNKQNYKKTQASHYPTITGSIDSSLSYDASGNDTKSDDYSVTLSANYSTTFFTHGHEDKIAKLSIMRSQENFLDLKRQILKEADQAWIAFELNKEQLEYQLNGIHESETFIRKATKEYNDGSRSLLDVLDAKVQILKEGVTLFNSYNAFTIQAFQMLQMENNLNSDDAQTGKIDVKLILDQIFLEELTIRKRTVEQKEDPAKVIQQIDEFIQI